MGCLYDLEMHALGSLYRLLYSAALLLLLGGFVLKIFEPGNAENAWVFEALRPLRPGLESLVFVLTLPVQLLVSLLIPVLPLEMRHGFPACPAAEVTAGLVRSLQWVPFIWETENGRQVLQTDYATKLPGVMDWRLPLAILFWVSVNGLVTELSHQGFRLARSVRQKRDWERKRSEAYEVAMQQFGGHVTHEEAMKQARGEMLPVISELREEIGGLQKRIHQDPLTGLFNKAYFLSQVTRTLREGRYRQGYVGLIVLDVDDFKKLNDTYGHPFGDRVLAEVGAIVRQAVPYDQAVPCRYGGEEIVIILLDLAPAAGYEVADRIRERISLLRFADLPDVRVTASLGLYTVKFSGEIDLEAETLIEKADQQMYKAKNSGKNRVCAGALV
jgi:diguanylate cyclase (GGDEF)-like protein